MAHLDGESSNELFEVLKDWNHQLEHLENERKAENFALVPLEELQP
jgi:hypothetical protein